MTLRLILASLCGGFLIILAYHIGRIVGYYNGYKEMREQIFLPDPRVESRVQDNIRYFKVKED